MFIIEYLAKKRKFISAIIPVTVTVNICSIIYVHIYAYIFTGDFLINMPIFNAFDIFCQILYLKEGIALCYHQQCLGMPISL